MYVQKFRTCKRIKNENQKREKKENVPQSTPRPAHLALPLPRGFPTSRFMQDIGAPIYLLACQPARFFEMGLGPAVLFCQKHVT